MTQAIANRRCGRLACLPPPVANYPHLSTAPERALLDRVMACPAMSSAGKMRAGIEAFIEQTGADELMIPSALFDHVQAQRSDEISAGIFLAKPLLYRKQHE